MANTRISPKDTVLIFVLIVILVGALYYLLFYSPLQNELAQIEIQSAELDTATAVTAKKIASMDAMQAELDEIFSRPEDEITEIAPYDNAKNMMNFLNGILSRSNEYELSSPDPNITEDGMVRRSVNLSFTCEDYATAKSILKDLASWNYRCLIKDVVISAEANDGEYDISTGVVSVRATLTFFESQKIS